MIILCEVTDKVRIMYLLQLSDMIEPIEVRMKAVEEYIKVSIVTYPCRFGYIFLCSLDNTTSPV